MIEKTEAMGLALTRATREDTRMYACSKYGFRERYNSVLNPRTELMKVVLLLNSKWNLEMIQAEKKITYDLIGKLSD